MLVPQSESLFASNVYASAIFAFLCLSAVLPGTALMPSFLNNIGPKLNQAFLLSDIQAGCRRGFWEQPLFRDLAMQMAGYAAAFQAAHRSALAAFD